MTCKKKVYAQPIFVLTKWIDGISNSLKMRFTRFILNPCNILLNVILWRLYKAVFNNLKG